MTGPVGVAVVGCGTISREYLGNLTSFPDLRVLFCADLDVGRWRLASRGRRVCGSIPPQTCSSGRPPMVSRDLYS